MTAWISALGLLDECPIVPAALTVVLERPTTQSRRPVWTRVTRFREAYGDASSASPRGVLPPFRPFATSIADSSAVSWAS